MNTLALVTAVVLIDLLGIVITKKVYVLNSFLNEWYDTYKLTASLLDCLIFIIVIMLVFFTAPKNASPLVLTGIAILYQIIHDVLFYWLVIIPLPAGENAIIDLFKKYVKGASVGVLIGDSIMMALIMGLYFAVYRLPTNILLFLLSLGIYSIGYMVYS